jgi:hypothetical protein
MAWIKLKRYSTPNDPKITLEYAKANPKVEKKSSSKFDEDIRHPHEQLCALDDIVSDYASIIPLMLEISPNLHKQYRCLIDTGSLQSNFASLNVKDDLAASRLDKRDTGCKVCSPISKVCIACDEQATLQCALYDDVNKTTF